MVRLEKMALMPPLAPLGWLELIQRERVIVCGYHGWQDWFIGSTSRNAGVPQVIQDLVETVEYNNLESLEKILNSRPLMNMLR